MTKNKKIIIIAAIVITVGVLIWLYWPSIKAAFSKDDKIEEPGAKTTGTKSTTSSSPGSGTKTTAKTISNGNSVWAAKNGANAYDDTLSRVIRTFKKDEYVGVVRNEENGWLTVSNTAGGRLMILKSAVRA